MSTLVAQVNNETEVEETASGAVSPKYGKRWSVFIKVLAGIQIVVGIVCFGIELSAQRRITGKLNPVAGTWCGVIFIINGISGGSGIKQKQEKRRTVMMGLVTGILAAIASLTLFGVSLYMTTPAEEGVQHHHNEQLPTVPTLQHPATLGWYRDPTSNALFYDRGDGWIYNENVGWQYDNRDGWHYDETNGWYFVGSENLFRNDTVDDDDVSADWNEVENITLTDDTYLLNVSADSIWLDEGNGTVYFGSNNSVEETVSFSNVSVISGLVNDTIENGWYYIDEDDYITENDTVENYGEDQGSGSGSEDGQASDEINSNQTATTTLLTPTFDCEPQLNLTARASSERTVTERVIVKKNKIIVKKKIKLYKTRETRNGKKKRRRVLIVNRKVVIRTKTVGIIKDPVSETPVDPCKGIDARLSEEGARPEDKSIPKNWPSRAFESLAVLSFMEFIISVIHVEICFRCLSSDVLRTQKQPIQNTTFIITNPKTVNSDLTVPQQINFQADELPDISYASQPISYEPPKAK